ncbi:Phosphoserine aminotransferase 2 [Abeliophyllum distichum]|uniref:Phosphoserine aminotransferase 2 n=1 Tax=Abeliophyllum distichum TaxID=126358 RepID=A0ABD1VT06_9LAMI
MAAMSTTTTLTPNSFLLKSTASTTSSDRVFNFAAGPAILPENVLLKTQSELYNWRGSGMSVMEMSYRGKEFLSIIQKAESDLQTLLNIPKNYSVLFLQGGATTQFAVVLLNLCKLDDPVDYIVTGSWGDKAFKEASKYCNPKTIWSGKSEKYVDISSFGSVEQTPDAKYLHICTKYLTWHTWKYLMWHTFLKIMLKWTNNPN